jgi:hypothetical protein
MCGTIGLPENVFQVPGVLTVIVYLLMLFGRGIPVTALYRRVGATPSRPW